MSKKNLLAELEEIAVVPLVTLNSVEEAVPLARALCEGGIPVAEVTFRSDSAIEGMKAIKKEVPEIILVAGTVHNVSKAQQAVEAGCEAIVTPAFNEEVVQWCISNNIAVLPGTVTPTDIEKAYNLGLRYVKFFPAQAYGGVPTLKALSGPFKDMKFLPTGGVSLGNMQEYMSLPNVFAVGGSFPVPSQAQREHDWERITQVCRQIVSTLRH